MLALRDHIAPGDGIWWSQGAAEATPLVDALLDQITGIGPCRAFCGLTWNTRLAAAPPELAMTSYGALGALRPLSRAGRLAVLPAHYSALPGLFADGTLPHDVGLLQVAPPGPDGRCSLGIGADYAADALAHTRTILAEVNRRMPVPADAPTVALDRFAAVLETDRPLPAAPVRAPDAVDAAIAAQVAGLVTDGDTIQLGVGSLPAAILDGLAGHRDLGFHAGLLPEGVLALIERGVITGARKEIDRGLAVTGTAIGGTGFYDRVAAAPVAFRPVGYTHDPRVLARLTRLVSVNAALEVDLTGQVGAEAVDGRYLGAVGGQADFSGAAARTGAHSVIAVRSGSIVAALRGPVTTARADVDYVVTEHGTARLRGAPLPERARRLIAVADPANHEELERKGPS